MQQPPKPANPKDTRNMMIFIVIAATLWFGFDHFVMKPKVEAYKKEIAAHNAVAPAVAKAEEKADIVMPREKALAGGERISIDTPELKGSFALTGIRFDDISFKNYFVEKEKINRVDLLSPASTERPYYADFGWLAATGSSVNVPGPDTKWIVMGANKTLTPETPVTLSWDNGAGLTFKRLISIDTHYLITLEDTVSNTGAKAAELYPYSSIARKGLPADFESTVAYQGPQGYVGDDLHEISYANLEEEPAQSFSGNNGWIGFGDKYWLATLIPQQGAQHEYRFSAQPAADKKGKALYQVDVRSQAVNITPGATQKVTTRFYAGTKNVALLDAYEEQLNVKHFDLAVDFGKLYFLTKPLHFLLVAFYNLVGNFGLAIIMLTIVVRSLVFPLANKSYKSFAMLKKISPKMAELKARYGDDKPQLQKELVKLYETEKVNPMAGCLPLLLQIPIFFAVYKVITISIEMRHAPFFGWIQDLSAHDPLTVFNLFGLLPYDVPSFLYVGPWSLMMLALMLVQKSMNPPPTDPIQRDMANYMPVLITYIMSKFPSGLIVYWAFSNLFSVIQQYVIMRRMGVPVYLFSKEEALEHHAQTGAETLKAVEKVKAEKQEREPVKEGLFDNEKPS